ncbi:unnamed protein product [Paramecium primaurelia]|uniref:Uncharacterized protein n=1 Tax=Paramecium primaurelia TaxID=5886 RepID=A0A8S1JU58_PARPR|nr:unnamed protein product [Paramecium primaurelia]
MQVHFQEKEALADIFGHIKDVDDQIFGVILEKLRKEKVQDIIGYLSDNGTQSQLESCILQKGENVTQADKEQNLSVVRNDIISITEVLRKLKDHEFNKKDCSSEENEASKLILINSFKDNKQIIEFLKFLVHLTSLDGTLIYSGSNSFNLLIQMKVDLRNQNFENINIQNTSLVGANLVRCNFSGSIFKNVNISGINLNGALLFNCKWRDLQISELNKLHGHRNFVNTVCFSPDGNTLASGSNDKSIRLWDVKTGQQKAKLDGHTSTVYSVCFSPDGNTLASGSYDKSIRLWDVKTGQEIKSSDKNYKDILAQFKIPLQNSSLLPNVEPDRTILRICQNPLLEASGTLILQGEFINHQGKDLKPLFKSKGCCFLEDLKQK